MPSARHVGHGDRTPRPPRPRGMKRLFCFDELPMVRVWMTGPHWRQRFGVHQQRVVEGKAVLVFSFEEDVRELVLVELRPGVYAQWADPREIFT